jgi:hypothetical protein
MGIAIRFLGPRAGLLNFVYGYESLVGTVKRHFWIGAQRGRDAYRKKADGTNEYKCL